MKNIHGYNFKRQNRPYFYVRPVLSKKDEYIPKTYVGMYSLLRNEKNKTIYMGEEACQRIREKTFNGILDISRKYSSPSFADLWNYNIAAINECGLNYFSTIPKFRPILGLIECIEHLEKNKTSRTRGITYVSFAIRKHNLYMYFKDVEEAKKEGRPVSIPHLEEPGTLTREEVIFGKKTINISEEHIVEIAINAIYNKFQEWLKIYGVEEREGVLMALDSLMREHSIDGLKDNNYYGIVTELDRAIFSKVESNYTDRLPITIPSNLYREALNIIRGYNLDADNLVDGPMTFNSYVCNAVHYLNSSLRSKYGEHENE